MSIKVLFFGQLTAITGTKSRMMSGTDNTTLLKRELFTIYPSLSKHAFAVAVNKKVIRGEQELNNGDSVALLPPFSGG